MGNEKRRNTQLQNFKHQIPNSKLDIVAQCDYSKLNKSLLFDRVCYLIFGIWCLLLEI